VFNIEALLEESMRKGEWEGLMTGAARQVTLFVRRTCWTSVLALSVVLAGCAGDSATGRHVVLATTTSVGNSGLLDAVLPPLQHEHGLQVRSHLVGSGLALRMLERGDADIVVSHSPEAEALGRVMRRSFSTGSVTAAAGS
jgi:ABC-type tungstate transport system permease subunit